jgi:choline-sulfatase
MKTSKYFNGAKLFCYADLFIAISLLSGIETQAKSFKNVIVLVGDDHAAGVLGCYGNKIIRTPNIDKMAANGLIFTSAYANAAICSPSRQSILTGKYPHSTGVTLLETSFDDERNETIAEYLKDNYNFKTAIIGKTHFNNDLHHGFELAITYKDYYKDLKQNPPQAVPETIKTMPPWRPFKDKASVWLNSEGLPARIYEKDDLSSYVNNKALAFMRENLNNRFFLWIGYEEPHSPFNFPVDFPAKYDPALLPLPNGGPEDDRWIPAIFRDLTEAERRGIIRSYYQSVEYLDKKVGEIFNEVKKLGIEKETLVIYVGDQGYLLYDHKRFEKHSMWEQVVNVPLIISTGGKYGKGRKIDAMTELVDVAPTILDLLGCNPLKPAQGKSLMNVILGKTNTHKKYVYCEFLEDNKVMIRSANNFKYVYTTGLHDLGQGYETGYGPSGLIESLYDLNTDPGETHNVFGELAYQSIMEELKSALLAYFMKTHPMASQLPPHLTMLEKFAFFTVPRDNVIEKATK